MISEEEFQKWISENAPLLEKMQRALDEFKRRAPEAVSTIIKSGWYDISHLTPHEAFILSKKFKSGEFDANESMIVHIQGNIEKIRNKLLDRHQARRIILNDAFEAHNERRYNLSIPVFLSQADGICQEKLGSKFSIFSSYEDMNSWFPKSKKKEFDQITGGIAELLTLPFREKSQINEHNLKSSELILNRNSIIHGESLDYGSEINSCKAISFISWLSDNLS